MGLSRYISDGTGKSSDTVWRLRVALLRWCRMAVRSVGWCWRLEITVSRHNITMNPQCCFSLAMFAIPTNLHRLGRRLARSTDNTNRSRLLENNYYRSALCFTQMISDLTTADVAGDSVGMWSEQLCRLGWIISFQNACSPYIILQEVKISERRRKAITKINHEMHRK